MYIDVHVYRSENKQQSSNKKDVAISGCNSVVECNLAKVDVEGSTPFTRSIAHLLRDYFNTLSRLE